MDREKRQKTERLAYEVMRTARDAILVHLRFLAPAMAALEICMEGMSDKIACDGQKLYCDPVYVLKQYEREPNRIAHSYLHVLLHCIFSHAWGLDAVEKEYWDMAADAAVENTILETDCPYTRLETDKEARKALARIKTCAGGLTAEKIYRFLKKNGVEEKERDRMAVLFEKDVHLHWEKKEEMTLISREWKKISRKMGTDLKNFSRGKQKWESLEQGLTEAVREKYDYGELLRRFMVMGEENGVNEEEFDYIYYTYGLNICKNMPFVEPLEYREEHRIKEFVIVLDTSASCRGRVVRGFLKKTYAILKQSENFFQKVNVHIIQCDSEIQSDTKITGEEEFQRFLREGKLHGFGATDFRPAFSYVNELCSQGEFENLKGLIYFTDGYGIYPETMPRYEVIFAYPGEDDHRAKTPSWAIPVVFYEEELEG